MSAIFDMDPLKGACFQESCSYFNSDDKEAQEKGALEKVPTGAEKARTRPVIHCRWLFEYLNGGGLGTFQWYTRPLSTTMKLNRLCQATIALLRVLHNKARSKHRFRDRCAVEAPFLRCCWTIFTPKNSITFTGEVLEWNTFQRDLKSR